jgi:hypothetical protein
MVHRLADGVELGNLVPKPADGMGLMAADVPKNTAANDRIEQNQRLAPTPPN